jgi:16S rRNA processing protein RimM
MSAVTAVTRPAAADPSWPDDAIEVGRVVDAWGLKGWLKVQPFAADPKALFSCRRWFVLPSERALPRPVSMPAMSALPTLLTIMQAREHGDVVVVQAREVPDRTAAEAMRGTRIFVPRSSFPTAGADEFYWIDLIGLAVVNREGVSLGTVVGLLETGAQSVLRVAAAPADPASPPADERLIPFVAAYIDDVDLTTRLVRVDWGLDY